MDPTISPPHSPFYLPYALYAYNEQSGARLGDQDAPHPPKGHPAPNYYYVPSDPASASQRQPHHPWYFMNHPGMHAVHAPGIMPSQSDLINHPYPYPMYPYPPVLQSRTPAETPRSKRVQVKVACGMSS